jgi:Rho-binding antiterminator
MKPYSPISCSFYDELEAAATRRELVIVDFWGADNTQQQTQSFIKNLYTKSKEEFVELENNTTIRLDQIIAINGKSPVNYC